MKTEIRNTLMLIALTLICMGESYGCPKGVGTGLSLSGVTVYYEHYTDADSFIDIGLKAECSELYFGQAKYPGGSASFTWNTIFSRKQSINGNEIRFFAGPGLIVGWSSDIFRADGVIFGLKGRVGAECEFDRNVTISVSFNPIIGTHMQLYEDYVDLRYYRHGLISSVIPEIGVRYTF